jgi:hypothetical protein
MIPRLIHQSWKIREIPANLREFQRSWQVHHPAWEYKLWTDADNRRLIDEHYPQFAAFYQRLSPSILKADFVRMAYMHCFGGLYVDLDFEALRPLDGLLNKPQIVVGREFDGAGRFMRGRDYVVNALMASPAGHSVWLEIMQAVHDRFRAKRLFEIRDLYVFRVMLAVFDEILDMYQQSHGDITIQPHAVFYPASPSVRLVEARRLLAARSGAHAIHHCENTWVSVWLRFYNLGLRCWQLARRHSKSTSL